MKRNEIEAEIEVWMGGHVPAPGELQPDQCIIDVIAKLPPKIRKWVMRETNHKFVCPRGDFGLFKKLRLLPPINEQEHDLNVVRLIILHDQLWAEPREEVLRTIAHELAHSYRNDDRETIGPKEEADAEEAADALAESWGFPTPDHRREKVAAMRRDEAERK